MKDLQTFLKMKHNRNKIKITINVQEVCSAFEEKRYFFLGFLVLVVASIFDIGWCSVQANKICSGRCGGLWGAALPAKL